MVFINFESAVFRNMILVNFLNSWSDSSSLLILLFAECRSSEGLFDFIDLNHCLLLLRKDCGFFSVLIVVVAGVLLKIFLKGENYGEIEYIVLRIVVSCNPGGVATFKK